MFYDDMCYLSLDGLITYPYYDVFNESYAGHNAILVIMNERHEHLIRRMRKCDLLDETNPGLPSLGLEASLYDKRVWPIMSLHAS